MVGEVVELIEKNTELQADSTRESTPLSEFFQTNGNKYPSFREAVELLYLYIR